MPFLRPDGRQPRSQIDPVNDISDQTHLMICRSQFVQAGRPPVDLAVPGLAQARRFAPCPLQRFRIGRSSGQQWRHAIPLPPLTNFPARRRVARQGTQSRNGKAKNFDRSLATPSSANGFSGLRGFDAIPVSCALSSPDPPARLAVNVSRQAPSSPIFVTTHCRRALGFAAILWLPGTFPADANRYDTEYQFVMMRLSQGRTTVTGPVARKRTTRCTGSVAHLRAWRGSLRSP